MFVYESEIGSSQLESVGTAPGNGLIMYFSGAPESAKLPGIFMHCNSQRRIK